MYQQKTISASEAMTLLHKGIEKAIEKELAMNLAVVDASGNLSAFARMDGAWIGSVDIAINKAFTAVAFAMPTGKLGDMSTVTGPLHGIQNTNQGRIVIFGGGYPLIDDEGALVGAVGVSGASVDEDEMIAEFMLEAFENLDNEEFEGEVDED